MSPDPASYQQNPTVVLSADARPFEQALEGSVKKYREWAGQIEQRAVAAGQKLRAESVLKGMGEELKKTQSRVDSVLSLAAGFTIAGKVAELAERAASAIRNWATGAEDFNKAVEKSSELAAKALKLQEQRIARAREMTDALGAGGPGARAGALEAELAASSERAAELSKQLDRAKKESKRLSTVWQRDGSVFQSWLGGGLEDSRNAAKKAEDEARAALESMKERTAEIERQLNLIKNPLSDPAKIAAVEKMVAEFDRARQMIGLSEENAKRLGMQLDGFAPEQIDKVLDSFKKLEEGQRARTLEDEIDLLRKQAELFGKSAKEQKLYELQRKGFSAEQLERYADEARASEALIAQKQREMDFFKQVEEYKAEQLKIGESGLVGAASGGSSAAANAIAAARADTARFTNATPEQKAELTRQQQLREQVKATAELQKLVGQVATLVSGIEGLSAL